MSKQEHELQKACVRWFSYQHSKLDGILWHTNNTAKDARTGRIMAGMGVVSGIPDLMMVYNKKLYGLELKTLTGRQSPSQKAWQTKFETQGGVYIVIRTLEGFINTVNDIIL